jgi:dTMP kinase
MPTETKRGFFITFEGLDGSGKTTQIQRLTKSLSLHSPLSPGITPLVTRQPGGTETGDRIRALLLDSKSSNLSPLTELAMMFADRAQAISEIIAPALGSGQLVICDRFTDSTEAYQGGGRQLGSQIVLDLHRLICGNLQPDLTILLLPDLAASLARARRRNTRTTTTTGVDENRFEQEQHSFFARVYEKYREIAARDSDRVFTIDGDLTIDQIHKRIAGTVSARLQQWQASSQI